MLIGVWSKLKTFSLIVSVILTGCGAIEICVVPWPVQFHTYFCTFSFRVVCRGQWERLDDYSIRMGVGGGNDEMKKRCVVRMVAMFKGPIGQRYFCCCDRRQGGDICGLGLGLTNRVDQW